MGLCVDLTLKVYPYDPEARDDEARRRAHV